MDSAAREIADSRWQIADGVWLFGFAAGGSGFGGVKERMFGSEVAQEILTKIAGVVGCAFYFTGLGCQVAFAFYGRIFDGGDPCAELARAGFSDCADFGKVVGLTFEFWTILYDGQHGAHFAAGTASDREEGKEFIGSRAFEAFGNVVGDGERCALELVAERWGEREIRFFEQIQDAIVED